MVEENKDEKAIQTTNKNIWRYATIALLVIVVLLLVVFLWKPGETSVTGGMLTLAESNDIANKTVDYINKNLLSGNTSASLDSITETSGILNITISIQGQKIPVYATNDGKLLIIPGYRVIDMSQSLSKPEEQAEEQPQETPKTDKPLMELFIFSYCPAGRAAETALVPVGKLLSNKADIKVKFFSHMHGQYEKEENIRQECIQSKQPNKFWDYTEALLITYNNNVTSCQKNTDCLNNLTDKIMDIVGIDKSKVHDCIKNEGESLYAKDQQDAAKYSLQYSPSFLINGIYLPNIQRAPDAIKEALCSAFITPPSECSQSLSTTGTAASSSCG